MTYTKGPWKHTAVIGGWDGVASEDGIAICVLQLNNPANARLIAAAPELLEALECAYDAIQKGHIYEVRECGEDVGTERSMIKAFLKDAINKAK